MGQSSKYPEVEVMLRQSLSMSAENAATAVEDKVRIAALERENEELRRATDLWRAAAELFVRELDPPRPR